MRVLYVCLDRGIPLGGTKGASIHVEELVRAFDAEGHETVVVTRSSAGAPKAVRAVFQARVEPRMRWVPFPTLRRDLQELAAGPALRRTVSVVLRAFRPNLVYERYALFRTETVQEAHSAGIPVVLEVNAPLIEEERAFRALALGRMAARAEREAWRAADLVTVPSRQLAERVRALGQARVMVVPNGVDLRRFRPTEESSAIRRRFGLDGRFVIGFAGSLKVWHDLGTLLEAAAGLKDGTNPTLLMLGEGPERARLEHRAASLGLDIKWMGAVPHWDVAGYLSAADVCVAGLPSDPRWQYFSPLKAMEYLACGRPTVVAMAGDLADLVEAGAALGYRPGDPFDLRRQLAAVAADPGLSERLSRAGRSLAECRTWRAAARSILQAAERLPRTESNAYSQSRRGAPRRRAW